MVVSLGAGVVADGRMLFLVVVVASVSVIVGIVAISIFLIIIETAGLEGDPGLIVNGIAGRNFDSTYLVKEIKPFYSLPEYRIVTVNAERTAA